MTAEPLQEAGGTLEPNTDTGVEWPDILVRLFVLERLPAPERERATLAWTPEERRMAIDLLGGPEQFLAFVDNLE